MRRLVIGIMLALFAVGAYSQGDDIYVFQKGKKEKSYGVVVYEMKSYMASLGLPSEDEVKEKVFKSFCGEWRTREGNLVTISEEKIEIEGIASFTKCNGYPTDIAGSSLYTGEWKYIWHHPFSGDFEISCCISISPTESGNAILRVDNNNYTLVQNYKRLGYTQDGKEYYVNDGRFYLIRVK